MKIPASLNFTNKTPSEPMLASFATMLSQLWRSLATVVNGQISFGNGIDSDNVAGTWIQANTPSTPNTDFIVVHNLGRLPAGYLIMEKSAACDVYTGSVTATDTTLTLRATVGSVVLRIFVL